jgi:hypothetical protein
MTVDQGTPFTPGAHRHGYALFRRGEGQRRDLAGISRNHCAAGFGISQATYWREVREGISVLAGRGRRISLRDVAGLAAKMGSEYLIVDGVHVPTVTFGRKQQASGPFTRAKRKRHGLNVQTVCSPAGNCCGPPPAQAAREGADGGAAGRESAAGPAPVRRRARQRPPEVLEGPGHGAGVPGTLHCHGQGRARCTIWSTTRSPLCAPRDPDRSLPDRNTGPIGNAVSQGHAKNSRNQRK